MADPTFDILKGTRLAWLTGSDTKHHNELETPEVDAPASSEPILPKFGGNKTKAFWVLGGILTILVPILVRNAKVNAYQNQAWGDAAYQVNQMYQQNQNKWYANGQEGDRPQGNSFFDVNNCKWYNWGCTPQYRDNQGRYVTEYEMKEELYRQKQEAYEQQQRYYEEQQEQEQQQQQQNVQYNQYNQYNQQRSGFYNQNQVKDSSPGLKIIYAAEVLLFLGLLYSGFKAVDQNIPATRLTKYLRGFVLLSIIAMICLKTIAIETDQGELEMKGYYGQFSVLMFMANTAFLIFAAAFYVLFATCYAPEQPKPVEDETTGEDYVNIA